MRNIFLPVSCIVIVIAVNIMVMCRTRLVIIVTETQKENSVSHLRFVLAQTDEEVCHEVHVGIVPSLTVGVGQEESNTWEYTKCHVIPAFMVETKDL